jgi:hypothetical protein
VEERKQQRTTSCGERDWNKWNRSPTLEEPSLGMGESYQRSSVELQKRRQYSWIKTLFSVFLQNLYNILARCFGVPHLLDFIDSLTAIQIISCLLTFLFVSVLILVGMT